jgi:hypothetical protein
MPTLETLTNHIAFSLMDFGIFSLSRLIILDGTHNLNGNNLKFKFGSKMKTGQIIAMNRLASLLNSENITPSSSVTYIKTRTRHLAKKKGLGESMLLL